MNPFIIGVGRGRGKPPPTSLPIGNKFPRFKIPGPIGLGRSSIRRLGTTAVDQPGRSLGSPQAKDPHYRDVEQAVAVDDKNLADCQADEDGSRKQTKSSGKTKKKKFSRKKEPKPTKTPGNERRERKQVKSELKPKDLANNKPKPEGLKKTDVAVPGTIRFGKSSGQRFVDSPTQYVTEWLESPEFEYPRFHLEYQEEAELLKGQPKVKMDGKIKRKKRKNRKKRKHRKARKSVNEKGESSSNKSETKDKENPLKLIQMIKKDKIKSILRDYHSAHSSTGSEIDEIEKLKSMSTEYRVARRASTIEEKKRDFSFAIIKNIGKGMSGVVYQVRDKLGNDYAMKALSKVKKINPEEEIKMSQYLRHLKCENFNCAQMLNYYVDEFYTYIQFPLYGPTLKKRICIKNESEKIVARSFQVQQIKEILSQLFTALNFLHSHHIVHLDLKLDNVIFTHGDWYEEKDPGSDIPLVKMVSTEIRLIDFGLAVSHPEHAHFFSHVCCFLYRPPESILGTKITYAVDIWGCGLLGVAMYLGCNLFHRRENYGDVELLAQMEIVMGSFPPKLLGAKNADQYFKQGRIIKPIYIKWKSFKYSRPLNDLKKINSSETDTLFSLLEKMLKLDSNERPKSEQLLQMIQLDS